MNEEIIKRLKDSLDYEFQLSFKDRKQLLDYITNLQQKIEEYQKDYERLYIEDCKLRENHNIDDISLLDENYKLQQDLDKANDIIEKDRQFYKCRMDEYVELKKENERFKADEKFFTDCGFTNIEQLSIAYNDYKSRCEKANEWIHKHQQTIENMRKEKFYILNLGVDDLKEFKNIINGGNNNE
jgi:hypothetical protein